MERCQVLYEICYSTPEFGWEPMGMLYETREEAEFDLRDKKAYFPTAFLARVVMTRCDEVVLKQHLHAVRG